ncbi:MAG: hypothetical protein UX38_C0003G0019 [Microgenomates group bacterium GW2011_GWC1_46_16]|nr:MAG: hypothetical protein UX32_C0002G0024 [Microgenomates group bacterium GW2011_GWF1_46_12]KKU26754.1 MAG: hypothetical protein UX38_C0003G0019 [Microgenomates group bacterium GW2011_GWC1_46_16]KKU27988.1 MAG: hypothetical protein UX40_C0004G0018 [Microgenomates group bacterium GW2011_GWF2_46_18]KKU44222.1 MAG: hypothetical protein UX59_C0002G0008 [Microgenomates group bacterium GW2011_GWA1_46_7]KKU45662.1 MAG: hypothetical protein UX63_C0002G0023 [Microgenomates group bacterium GW2011_GWB1
MSMPEFNEGMIEGEQGKGVEPFLRSALEQHETDAGVQTLPELLGMMELYGQPADREYGLKQGGWAKTGEEMSKELGSYVKGEGQLSNQTQIAVLEAVGVMAEKAGQLRRSPAYPEWNRQRKEAMATLTKRWGVEHGYAMSGQEYVPVSQLLGWSKPEQRLVKSGQTESVDLGQVWKDIKIETARKLTDSLANVKGIIDFAIKHPREVAVNVALTATLAACGVANGEGRPTVEIPNGGGETPAAVVSSTMTATAESNGQTITFQEQGFEVGEGMTLTSGMLDLAKMEQMYPDGVEALRTLGKVPEAMNFGQVIVQDANGEDIEYSLAMDPATGEAMVGWIAGAGNEWRTPEAGEAVVDGTWNWVKVSITKGSDGSELVSAFGGRMVLFEVGADGTWKVGLPIIDALTGEQIVLDQVLPGGGGGGLFAPKEFFAETLPGEPTEAPTQETVEVNKLQPETVGCLHPEDIETWCAGLEPKDPHGLWQDGIDALVDGPANADYWASTLGKTNPTHEEIITWLADHDYFLPSASPDGTEWVWVVGNPGYPEFKTNEVVTEAGGVSLKNIWTVVISPDNWSQIKDWWRAQIDAQRNSPPIKTGGDTVYSPTSVYGWLAVKNGEKGLVEMVFVGGSSYIPDNARQKGYDKVMMGGEGANNAAVFTAMWESFMRASREFAEKDLDLGSPDDKTPSMSIVGAYKGEANYPTDPSKMEEEEIWFE